MTDTSWWRSRLPHATQPRRPKADLSTVAAHPWPTLSVIVTSTVALAQSSSWSVSAVHNILVSLLVLLPGQKYTFCCHILDTRHKKHQLDAEDGYAYTIRLSSSYLSLSHRLSWTAHVRYVYITRLQNVYFRLACDRFCESSPVASESICRACSLIFTGTPRAEVRFGAECWQFGVLVCVSFAVSGSHGCVTVLNATFEDGPDGRSGFTERTDNDHVNWTRTNSSTPTIRTGPTCDHTTLKKNQGKQQEVWLC